MGGCATKLKGVKDDDGDAPEPAPESVKPVEEAVVAAAEEEKKVEVEVKGDKIVVEEELVDDDGHKTRSLSHLFKENEAEIEQLIKEENALLQTQKSEPESTPEVYEAKATEPEKIEREILFEPPPATIDALKNEAEIEELIKEENALLQTQQPKPENTPEEYEAKATETEEIECEILFEPPPPPAAAIDALKNAEIDQLIKEENALLHTREPKPENALEEYEAKATEPEKIDREILFESPPAAIDALEVVEKEKIVEVDIPSPPPPPAVDAPEVVEKEEIGEINLPPASPPSPPAAVDAPEVVEKEQIVEVAIPSPPPPPPTVDAPEVVEKEQMVEVDIPSASPPPAVDAPEVVEKEQIVEVAPSPPPPPPPPQPTVNAPEVVEKEQMVEVDIPSPSPPPPPPSPPAVVAAEVVEKDQIVEVVTPPPPPAAIDAPGVTVEKEKIVEVATPIIIETENREKGIETVEAELEKPEKIIETVLVAEAEKEEKTGEIKDEKASDA